MSMSKRIFNIARAELRSAFRGLTSDDETLSLDLEEEIERGPQTASPPHPRGVSTQISRFYANLELPIGAGPDEVRAAYRRMMRRYHPDRHHQDGDKTEVATELAQRLRAAHDGLLEHLGAK